MTVQEGGVELGFAEHAVQRRHRVRLDRLDQGFGARDVTRVAMEGLDAAMAVVVPKEIAAAPGPGRVCVLIVFGGPDGKMAISKRCFEPLVHNDRTARVGLGASDQVNR